MTVRTAFLIASSAAVLLAGCQRAPARGAEAAAHVADAPKPTPVLIVSEPAPPPSDAAFLSAAAASDAFEIAAARLALARPGDPRVRTFAGTMLRDHGASSGGLAKAAAESGQALSPAPAASDPELAAMARLERADPASFDAAYMTSQVEAHQRALGLLQAYAQDGQNPSLRAFASGASSVVAAHLAAAQRLAEQVG